MNHSRDEGAERERRERRERATWAGAPGSATTRTKEPTTETESVIESQYQSSYPARAFHRDTITQPPDGGAFALRLDCATLKLLLLLPTCTGWSSGASRIGGDRTQSHILSKRYITLNDA